MADRVEASDTFRPRLGIIIASTRPTRVGPAVARWFAEAATRHGVFALDVVDLAELGLPLLDEPNHPRLARYTKPHTQAWSERVRALDALALVVPEYNYSMGAPLKNAFDFLFWEWQYKPVGFVSYGGISGGLRSVEMTKTVVTALKMMPVPEAVAIPLVRQILDESGAVVPTDPMEAAATALLNELARWEGALRGLRAEVRLPEPAAR